MPADTRKTWPGGLTRIVAWLIDMAVVFAVSYVLALPFLARMTASPALARLEGGLVGLAYFGVLSSRLGGGRTLGLRLLGVKLIRLDGQLVSLPRSMARAAILIAPVVANGWDVWTGVPLVDQGIVALAFTAVFGLTLAQIYLIGFNQPTGRLAHDILTRTAVVYRSARNWNAPPIRLHGALALAILLAGAGASYASIGWVVSRAPLVSRIAPDRAPTAPAFPMAAVEALPEVMSTSAAPPPPPTASYAPDLAPIVTVRLKAWPADFPGEIQRIGAAASKTIPMHAGEDMKVIIKTGFNTGFAFRFRSASGDYIG